MTSTDEVGRFTDTIMAMIKEDQDSGQVPRDVCTWDELDESVDTDDYYRQARLPSGTREAAALRNAVSDEIGRRLAGALGGPWRVSWTRADGHTQEIGRTIGYATAAAAEAVGREYLTEHGGSYEVRRG